MGYYYPGAFTVLLPDSIAFVTITVIDWVDVFTRDEYKRIIADSLDFCRKKKGLNIYAWVLMTNHIHLIVSHEEGNEKLAKVLGEFKKFTAKKVINALLNNSQESRSRWILKHFEEDAIMQNDDASCSVSRSNLSEGVEASPVHYHLWQRGYDIFFLSNIKTLRQKIDYLHANPIRAGFVEKPWEYLYSSYKNYCDEPALIEIDLIDLGLEDPRNHRRW